MRDLGIIFGHDFWTRFLECVLFFWRDIELTTYFFRSNSFEWMSVDVRPLLHLDVRQLINHDDIEADIMQGLVHLQLHRRAKSLRRFRTHHSDENAKQLLRPGTLAHIFLPLVTHILYETEKSSDYVIVDEAIATIASISSHLPWSRYYSVIRLLLVQLQRRPEKEKVLMKAVCASIESFHFDCTESVVALKVITASSSSSNSTSNEENDGNQEVEAEEEEALKEIVDKHSAQEKEEAAATVVEEEEGEEGKEEEGRRRV